MKYVLNVSNEGNSRKDYSEYSTNLFLLADIAFDREFESLSYPDEKQISDYYQAKKVLMQLKPVRQIKDGKYIDYRIYNDDGKGNFMFYKFDHTIEPFIFTF